MKVLQLLAEARPADAVTNQALWIDRALTELGHEPALASDAAAPELEDRVQPACQALAARWDLVLDHYSIGAGYHELLPGCAAPRWLIYHNVTPAALLSDWAPAVAERCAAGRARLEALLPGYRRALADSRYNAAELTALGHRDVEVLPICVEPPAEASRPPLASLARVHAGGGPLLLFVGRVAPQKNHFGLLRLLRRLRQDGFPGAELLLVGDARGFERYDAGLRHAAAQMGLDASVRFTGKVPDVQLWSYYRLASAFVCLSRHEGFCVPLVEAFAAGLPVVAAAAGAVPETAGDAALLAADGDELHAAELCRALLQRPDLAEALAARGRERARGYGYPGLLRRLQRLLED
jgi:glycosyltransferase involved in cell wall biosynthesis